MSLRFKSLLIFSAAVTLLFALVLGMAKITIEREFTAIEFTQMNQQAERFSFDLASELRTVTSSVGDWAPWDELFEYAAGRDPAFPARNLDDHVLPNLRIDFFAIYDRAGQLVTLQTAPEQFARNGLTPDTLRTAIQREGLVPQRDIDEPDAGLLLAGDQIVMVAALPIVPTDRAGPAAGTLVGGRIFGADEIHRFEQFAGYRARFLGRPDANAGPTPVARGRLAGQTAVEILNPREIAAWVPLYDVGGHHVADAELVSNRPLHLQASKTIRIFVIGLASAAGILLFVVWYLLDSNVIHPVRQLAAKLTEAGARGELPSDLGVPEGGELAELAHCIENLARSVARAEANYRAIVEDQTEFIFRYLPNGRITFVNGALCRYLGCQREDLLGGDAHRFVADDEFRRVDAALEQLSVDSPVVTTEHRANLPHNRVTWFRRTDRGIFSEEGRLRELQCVARDVTQTRLASEQLAISETRYRRLFETATDGILIVRQIDQVVTDANPSLCALLDRERGQLIERPFASIPAIATPRSRRLLAPLLNGDAPLCEVEITVKTPAGDHRYLEVTSRAYDTGNERVVQLNFRDISLRKHANDKLRELSGRLLRLQDDERRRIARDLHDSTAQLLTALQIAVTKLDPHVPPAPSPARATLDEIRSLTDQSLGEIRTISYLLHPPLLDEVGLLFALRWYVNGFMTRTERIVRLDLPDSLDRLPSDVETTIFRVVQESLSNIHRHSGSRRAWIRLALERGALHLEIRDEGEGFPTAILDGGPSGPAPVGVGIAGMRERLRQFNGSLAVESGRAGTTVRAILPLEFDDAPPSASAD